MNYYVYVYLDPLKAGNYNFGKFHFDYEPFYIGMGKNDRIDSHINEAKIREKKVFKHLKILKIIKNGKLPIRYKLYENITIFSAKRLEKYLIKKIGRRNLGLGPLSNLTDGGEGSVNLIHSKETIQKIKKTIANNGKSRKGEFNSNYGHKWTDEQKKLGSERCKNNHKHLCGGNNPSNREDVKLKLSETKMGLKNPNACLWELVPPSGDTIKIEGGIKRALKEHGLTYQIMRYKIENGVYFSKNGWKLSKIL